MAFGVSPQQQDSNSQVGQALVTALIVDFVLQFVAYALSAVFATEKLFDLSGALTFIACTLITMLLRYNHGSIASLGFRQILVGVCILLWTCRLGFYLYRRVLKIEDKRFEQYKASPVAFTIPFFMQFIWIYLTAFPVLVILANHTNTQNYFEWTDAVGAVIWLAGFLIEIIADETKSAFKSTHPDDFISTGIWAYSRYANYFGEITLWVGMFIMCCGGFVEYWQWVTIISPLFIMFLILCVSGVPISEKSAIKRYGHRQDYQDYVARTSKIIPWFPRNITSVSVPVETTHLTTAAANATTQPTIDEVV
ncbi:hypothetical protein BDV3_005643 [Batrachochytrium dendrobatidis]|nr:hypothetical protein O5D80_003750 [Batrachochytrium dendrobatidis]KAK5673453.1 hypothetical protein QVD99_000899 [Batrachochytrium dendrobatidis]